MNLDEVRRLVVAGLQQNPPLAGVSRVEIAPFAAHPKTITLFLRTTAELTEAMVQAGAYKLPLAMLTNTVAMYNIVSDAWQAGELRFHPNELIAAAHHGEPNLPAMAIRRTKKFVGLPKVLWHTSRRLDGWASVLRTLEAIDWCNAPYEPNQTNHQPTLRIIHVPTTITTYIMFYRAVKLSLGPNIEPIYPKAQATLDAQNIPQVLATQVRTAIEYP